MLQSISVATWSKACVCGHSLAWTAIWNADGGMIFVR